MDASFPRLTTIVHYVIARTEPSELGYTKLNKALWYADLEHYRRHGESLTGLAHYDRMPQGPMSKEISLAVRRLKRSGQVAERPVKVIDYTRRELISIKEPDISVFTAEQIDILNQVMAVVRKYTAAEVSDSTHRDPLWKEQTNGGRMKVGAGSVVSKPLSHEQLDWALKQLQA
jgi:hypothetical protein